MFSRECQCASDVTRGNAASPGSVTTTPASSVTTTLETAQFMWPDTVDVCNASQRITISSKWKLKRIVSAIGKKRGIKRVLNKLLSGKCLGGFSTMSNIKIMIYKKIDIMWNILNRFSFISEKKNKGNKCKKKTRGGDWGSVSLFSVFSC